MIEYWWTAERRAVKSWKKKGKLLPEKSTLLFLCVRMWMCCYVYVQSAECRLGVEERVRWLRVAGCG